MAQDFKSTGTQITNSETTLLTANSNDAIIGLRLANITASSVTVDIYIDKGGAGTDRYIAKTLSIPPATSIESPTREKEDKKAQKEFANETAVDLFKKLQVLTPDNQQAEIVDILIEIAAS